MHNLAMLLECSESMAAVGFRLQDGAQLFPIFARSAYLPQSINARLSLGKFSKINTTKGRWALIDDLTTIPESSATPPQLSQVPVAAVSTHPLFAAAAGPASMATAGRPLLTLGEAQHIVHTIAVEVLGEGQLGSSGQLPAGM